MSIRVTLQLISLISILFISQMSNAFTYSSFNFVSSSGHPCSNEVDTHSHSTGSETLSQYDTTHSATLDMDCCDMSVTSCCGADCQCVTVSATAVYLPVDTSECAFNQGGLNLLTNTPDIIHPLPSLLIRPPISFQS